MGRRGALLALGCVLVGVAVASGLIVFQLAQGEGFGPDPIIDFLVWFGPIIGVLGVGLLAAGAFAPRKVKPDPPYRPLDR